MSFSLIKNNKNDYEHRNYLQMSAPSFRFVNNPVQPIRPQQYKISPDEVKISAENNKKSLKKKKGLTTLQKWKVGIAAGIATIITAGILLARHQTHKLTKLYNEKLQLVHLAEKIDFKEAKSLEEGIKFAKETLKIGEIGEGFTLDAINFVNKGLVDVSNANKGRLFIPKKICYRFDNAGAWLASVNGDITSADFGMLEINAKYFDENVLDNLLNACSNVGKKSGVKGKNIDGFNIPLRLDSKIKELEYRYSANQKSLSLAEKRNLFYNIMQANIIQTSMLDGAPLNTLKNNMHLFERAGLYMNIEKFAKLPTDLQSMKLKELLLELHTRGIKVMIEVPYLTPEAHTIYHEMGHLQDFGKNLKALDLSVWALPSFKDLHNAAKKTKKIGLIPRDPVGNRWGGLTYGKSKELLAKNSRKFKEYYPDLYEFLLNQEKQQTASKVSWYASTSIGEFIAEVYSKMMRGEKIPSDVMDLYKKYDGPTIPF